MLRFIPLLIVFTLFSCEDNGAPGFQGTKIDKETASAPTDGKAEVDSQAVPPTSISGAWLVCEWIDQSAGKGGCAILDRDGHKLKIDTMTLQFWRIVFRDGGVSLKTEFTLQEPVSPYHVIFQVLPGQEYQAANIDIVYSQNGAFLTKNLSQVFTQGANPTISSEGGTVYTALRDLKVPADKIAALPDADRAFYLWPDPEKSTIDAGENARVVSSELIGSFDPQQFVFNPDAYCGANGAVGSQISAAWQSQLQYLSTVSTERVRVRPEIVKAKQSIFLPAWEECVLPIRTGTLSRTAVSSDGQCMFMLVQARMAPAGFTQLQPYLLIFTKRFADAVGFQFSDVEAAAGQFPCL